MCNSVECLDFEPDQFFRQLAANRAAQRLGGEYPPHQRADRRRNGRGGRSTMGHFWNDFLIPLWVWPFLRAYFSR
jgi:hypothetical protein